VGILKTAATVAVASSVHGRVQRRQQRWAAQDQVAAPAAPPQVPAPTASSVDGGDRLAQLTQLGDLKNAGVLTEAEFEREKARVLNG